MLAICRLAHHAIARTSGTEEFRYEYDLTFESDYVTFHHEYELCLGESAEEEEETEKEEAEEDEDGPISDEL